jgi:hypothetical protein
MSQYSILHPYQNTALARLYGIHNNSGDVPRCSWILNDDDEPIHSFGSSSNEEEESADVLARLRVSQEERIMKLLLCPKLTIVEKRFTNDIVFLNTSTSNTHANANTTNTPQSIKCPTHAPPEVLRQVTIKGYLNFHELGRFLLCTSKSFVPTLGSEYVWKYLCQSKWKYTLHMDESLIQAVGGYETLFHKLSRRALLQREQDPKRELAAFFSSRTVNNNVALEQWSPLPQATLKLEQLQLFLSLRNGSNQELVSIQVSHENLVQFVGQGQVQLWLDNNNNNNNNATSSPIRIDVPLGEPLESQVKDWTATLHLVRLDTLQICAINKADAVSVHGNEVKFLSQWLPLTPKGRHQLERRIQAHDVTYGETYLGISCQVQIPLQRVSHEQLQLDRIQLQVRRRHGRFPSALLDARQEEQRQHGVTLLHLWNELQGWDDF